MKALILLADGFEDLHLFCPWYRLREDAAQITLASPAGKNVTGRHGYIDKSGNQRTVFLSYLLEKTDNTYYITQVGTAPDRTGE